MKDQKVIVEHRLNKDGKWYEYIFGPVLTDTNQGVTLWVSGESYCSYASYLNTTDKDKPFSIIAVEKMHALEKENERLNADIIKNNKMRLLWQDFLRGLK